MIFQFNPNLNLREMYEINNTYKNVHNFSGFFSKNHYKNNHQSIKIINNIVINISEISLLIIPSDLIALADLVHTPREST